MTSEFIENNRKFLLDQIRPAWIEVDLSALEYNAKSIKEYIGSDTKLMGVIKANAYSHGAVESAESLLEGGVDYLAVATLGEAMQLRMNGIMEPVLILGFTPLNQLARTIDMEVSQTIFSLDQAKKLSQEAEIRGRDANIHIKIDTGMTRLGFTPNRESLDIIKEINQLPNLNIEGIFSHFSESDAEDMTFTDGQFDRFIDFIGQLKKEDIRIPIKHISNAAAVIDRPEYNLDMVRVGISLFGIYPSGHTKRERLDIKPALEIKSKISCLRTVPPSTYVGYNRTYKTDRETTIATIPIGYADGYTQDIANTIDVSVKGKKVAVIGRVCMDQLMIDVTDIPQLEVEDEVTLIGKEDRDLMTTHFVSNLSSRLPRVYLRNEHILKVIDSLKD